MKIKVLSLNTWMGGLLWQPCYDFITSQPADILLLQEVYAGTEEWYEPRFRSKQLFESALPEFHSYFSALMCDLRANEGPIDNGNLILSRWPIKEPDVIFFDQPYVQYDHDRTTDYTNWPAAAQKVIVQLPNQTNLQLINIHGPVWYQGAEPTERRIQMVNSINKMCGQDIPTIITGDSNATPDNPCWRQLKPQLQSVFSKPLKTTFNMLRKSLPGFAGAAVDIFYISPEFKLISAACLDVDVSDHLPLVVDLELD